MIFPCVCHLRSVARTGAKERWGQLDPLPAFLTDPSLPPLLPAHRRRVPSSTPPPSALGASTHILWTI